MEPYTHLDPVSEKTRRTMYLWPGRPKQWKSPDTQSQSQTGRSIKPSTGRMYESVGGWDLVGGLDFMGFIYDNMAPFVRMLSHTQACQCLENLC